MTTWPTKPFRHGIRRQIVDTSDASLVGAWGGKVVDGVVPDETGNGNDGVPQVGAASASTILGQMMSHGGSDSTGIIDISGASYQLTDVTVSAWITPDRVNDSDYVFNYMLDLNDGWGVRIDSNVIAIYDDIDNAGAELYATTILAGRTYHVVAVMDSLENKLYLDGELVGSGTSSSDNWASLTASARFAIGGRHTGVSGQRYSGRESGVRIYNEAKPLAWVQAQYALGAPAVQFGTDWGVTESIAAESSGLLGQGSSPFQIGSGTHKISTDTINGQLCKVIECVTAGRVWLNGSLFMASQTEMLHGSFRMHVYKADASTMNFYFVDDSTLANDSGYRIRLSNAEAALVQVRTTGGTGADVINSGTGAFTANAWHQWDMTLAYDGEFYLYCDRSSLGNGTDTTHKTSNYLVIDMDAGDKVAYANVQGGHSIVKYLGVVAP